MTTRLTHRQRLRQATREEIMQTARQQIAEDGNSALSLQAWVIRDQAPAAWRWLLVSPPLWAISWLIAWAIGVDVSFARGSR